MRHNFFFFLLFLLPFGVEAQTFKTKFDTVIPVLNIGTFHMGYTDDANSVDFNEHDANNVQQVHAIAKKIAAFKPTVIVVETTPGYQLKLDSLYKLYVKNPKMKFENPDEVELLAYEVGRLSGATRIVGIDYKENYNYSLFYQLKNKVDSLTVPTYGHMMEANEKLFLDSLGREPNVMEMLQFTNLPEYLDYLINVNADLLTYVSTKGNHEGAEEAAKFYHRNLVMYSNLNQIELSKDDRVFILMGATHTAYFNEFMKRSPKYKLENVFEYLQ